MRQTNTRQERGDNATYEQQLQQRIQELQAAHSKLVVAYARNQRTQEKEQYWQLLQKNEQETKQLQKESNQRYQWTVRRHLPKVPVWRNVWRAFLVGGGICAFGQLLIHIAMVWYAMEFRSAAALASIGIVILTALLTGIGVYDEIGRFGGAGSMVPISGFANSVVSAALEFRREGMIYGIGAKIFTIAGPVILYGTVTSVCLGLIFYIGGFVR